MNTRVARCIAASIVWISTTAAQQDYYASVYKLSGPALRTALHHLIKGHTQLTYADLWTAFALTDKKPNGKVWDFYSDVPNGTPPYEFTFTTNQCGNYSNEGDCYNREHTWPQSWFGGSIYPMYSDLHHLYPTDGKVNGMRGNWPFGPVSTPTWTSRNGGKLGPCTAPGYSGTAFEPIDPYKGDIARAQFYMSVRYYLEDAGWIASEGTSKSELLPWYANALYEWHLRDTVSDKETARNNMIAGSLQRNRNPFIDHPEFAAEIWKTGMAPSVVSVVSTGTTALVVDFSRYLDSSAAVTAGSYVIDQSIGSPVAVEWGINNDVSKVRIVTSPLAPGTTYALQIRNMKSINNVPMRDTTVFFQTAGTSGVGDAGRVPGSIDLEAFPNPFNSQTQFRISVPAQPDGRVESPVSLRIVDLLGRDVAVLLHEAGVTGSRTVTWDAAGIPSGTYFCRLQSGRDVVTRKLLLTR